MAGYRLYRHHSYDAAAARLPAAVQRKAIWAQVLLGVRGRTPSVKSTVGLNARWRRTPVQGNHYYLWWLPAAEAETSEAAALGSAAAPAILVHSIRHHDATDDALEVGAPNDYEEIPVELLDPRFDEQIAVGHRISGAAPGLAALPSTLTTIKGLPGSGKSVSLLYLARDLAERPGVRKIRYVTYTERLKRAARELIAAHGHDLAQRLTVHTVNDVVSELTGVALPAEPFGEVRDFVKFLDLQKPAALGPWRRYPLTLYTEMRGALAGRTFPPGYALPAARLDQLRLGEGSAYDVAAYAAARDLDPQLAELVVNLMQRTRDTALFLDQRAAYRALEAIQRGDSPRWLAESDAVIVDEVQDLTLLQIALIGELGRLRLRKPAATPFVMTVAGDESQIVQPSGFDWGVTKDLLAEQLGAHPQEHEFRHQRRSPPSLGHVIDNSWSFYGHLPKALRPSARRQSFDFASEGPATESAGDVGLVMVVQPPGPGDGQGWRDLLAELAERPGRAVVDMTADSGESLQASLPGALPEDAEEVLFLPREIKGLERGTVIVRGLDLAYRRARDLSRDPDGLRIPQLEARRLFDEMRVALSRSTNRLVIVEPRDAAVFAELKLDQVQGCLHLSWRELVDFLSAEDMTEIEMIELLLDEVEDLAERTRWEQAQRRNRRAHDLAVQIGDDSLRRDAAGQYVDLHFQEADSWLARRDLPRALDAAGRGRTIALELADPVVLERVDEAWERIQDAAAQEVARLLADASAARAANRFEAAHSAARTACDLAQIAPASSFAARAAEALAQAALDWATVLLDGDGPAPEHPPRAAELLHEAARLVAAQGDAPGGAALALLAARYDAVPQRRNLTPDQVRAVLESAREYLRAVKPLAPGDAAYRIVRGWLDETFAALGDHSALYYDWAATADRLALDTDYPPLDERIWDLENRLGLLRRPAHDPAVTRFRAFAAAYNGDPGTASLAWEELGEMELAVQQARLAGDLERAYNLMRQARLPIAEELATAVKALRLLQQVEQKQHGLTPAERRAILEELTRLHAQLSENTDVAP